MRALLHCMIALFILTTYQIHGQVHHFHRRAVASMPIEKQKKEEDTIRYLIVEQKLLAFIYENLRLPSEAINAKIEGRVTMQFIIEPDGEITNVRVVRDIGYGCGTEATRIVKLMNHMDAKWVPGKHDGKNVRVKFHLPITFKLT